MERKPHNATTSLKHHHDRWQEAAEKIEIAERAARRQNRTLRRNSSNFPKKS